jgi:cytidine deaminase
MSPPIHSRQREQLIQTAIEAKSYAYAPYSKFRVGAALLCADGTVIKGCNVENACYGGTICAERTAIVKAISEGKKDFVAMAVTTDVPATISPCGICRQVLREFCHLDTPILLVPADYPEREKDEPAPTQGGVRVETVGGLLPLSFGPEDLERPRIPARADIEK